MSYSVFGKIIDVDKKKVIAEGYFDKLKNITSARYSSELKDVEESSAPFDMNEILQDLDSEEKEFWRFYSLRDFENAEKIYEDRYAKSLTELNRIESIKKSIDYYHLNQKEKEELNSDILYLKEDVEEFKWELETVKYIENVLYFYENELYDEDFNRKVILATTVR